MEKKICNTCRVEKDFCDFHKGKTKDGYQYKCKLCKKKYSTLNVNSENIRKNKWRLNNVDKVKNSKKKYYQSNRSNEIKKNTIRNNERKKK